MMKTVITKYSKALILLNVINFLAAYVKEINNLHVFG